MSYSTRRSAGGPGGYGQQQQPQHPKQVQQQTVGNIGQRRPVVTNNFVSGGQAKPMATPGQPTATPQQQIKQQTPQQSTVQFKNQAQPQATPTMKQQQNPLQQQQIPPQQQQIPPQQQQKPPQQQQKPPTLQQQPVPQQLVGAANGTELAMETSDDGSVKKHFWARGGGKISKKEKVRRRNVKLSKILQPKNAVMILNELVNNTAYVVKELPVKSDGNQFEATVLYDGIEHVGYGRSKIHAKNIAAETALQHYVKTNKLTEVKKESDTEKMDVAEDESTESPLPWQHVASFALYKLFCSWGEDPNIVKTQSQNLTVGVDKQHDNKPAKKMPENPETINPLMLINQMLPQAEFEEVCKIGNPPDVKFSFRCNVNGQSFEGTGPNKKAAKKMAAYEACSKILGVNYPGESPY